jgi:hypothetical protein
MYPRFSRNATVRCDIKTLLGAQGKSHKDKADGAFMVSHSTPIVALVKQGQRQIKGIYSGCIRSLYCMGEVPEKACSALAS